MIWHIIGSTGFVGRNLLKRVPPELRLLRYARRPKDGELPLELTALEKESLSAVQPGDFVVLLAAVSSPDACRDRYDEVYASNVTGTKALVSECLRRDARVLFFSSDVVVGATDCPHDETMPVSPVGNYGAMKREVEQAFAGEPRFKVFRLSYVFSREDKFMRYLRACAETGETADVFQALYRNVVYLGDVLDAVFALGRTFDRWDNQIFHLSGPELLCRADMAARYQAAVAPALRYTTSIPDPRFFEARPNTIETASRYLSRLLRREPTPLADAMAEEFQSEKEQRI